MQNDPLAGMEFEAELACEVLHQPYLRRLRPFRWLPEIQQSCAEVPVRGKCPNSSAAFIHWRACPCIADVRRWEELHPDSKIKSPVIVAGLPIIGTPMCQKHIDYFTDFVIYPFTCSGCGVSYLHPGEMLLDGDENDLFEAR